MKDLIVDTIETIIGGYRKILAYAVVPPYKMNAIKDHLKLNAGSLLFATILLVFAKAFAGQQANILDSLFLNLGIAFLSIFLLFLVPTVVLLMRKAEVGKSENSLADQLSPSEIFADKLSSVAIFIWMVSLTIFIGDHLVGLLANDNSIMNWLAKIGNSGTQRAVAISIYTAFAVVILLVRSERSVTLTNWDRFWAWITLVILGCVNVVLMYLTIFKLQVTTVSPKSSVAALIGDHLAVVWQ